MTSRYANKNLTNAGAMTIGIHSGSEPDPVTGAILPPIYQTATYAQEAVGVNKGHTYTRSSNPTVYALEKRLAAMEGIVPPALTFATGMAALTTLCLTLLKSGDHVICSDVIFGGSVRLFDDILLKYGISISYVDAAESKNVASALQNNSKMIFIETPANPTLKLNDIQAIAAIARQHNLPLVVDNTFMPGLQKPFQFGADIVLYSTTKYIDGHNATVGGALLAKDAKYIEELNFTRKTIGTIQAPFDAWLILQGLKTLDLRIKQHSQNALQVAKFLASHPQVSRVIYPGLDSFPQQEIALRQHENNYHGGMLAFEVIGGAKQAIKVMNSVRLCALAESLGATESLITHPASMTHVNMSQEAREAIGISEGLIRFSVGLEDAKDIIQDLAQALA